MSGFLARAVARADSWVNLITSVGGRGRNSFTHLPGVRLDDATLEDLFYSDPYASRIVKEVPEEAMRRGFTLKATFDERSRGMNSRTGANGGTDLEAASRISHWFKSMHVNGKLTEAWTWGRLFGGGALLIGADDGRDPALPIDMKALRSIVYVVSVDKRELFPTEWFSDPDKPNFGEPSVYQLSRSGATRVDARRIHATRVIRFDGAMTNRWRRRANQGWSESELQRVYTALQKFNGAYEAVGTLLQESSQGVFGIKGLWEKMAGDGLDAMKKRLEIMDLSRSVARSILIDKEEESFERVEVGALSGLPDTLRTFMLFLAGASGIPVTILMGQAPAGLSATGESDIRMYYGRIASARTNYLEPKIIRLATILCAANEGPTRGAVPQIDVTFPSMYESTPAEEADQRNKQAMTDQIYIQTQVVTPEEVGTSRFRDEGYSFDTTIETRQLNTPPDENGEQVTTFGSMKMTPEQLTAATDVVSKVGARVIARDTGIAMLMAGFPLDADGAEAIMGETGKTVFTTPAPEHEAAHAALQQEHEALQRSHTSRGAMLSSVLAENKAGRLVQGSPIVRKQAAEGDPLPAPDATSLDARGALRMSAVMRFDADPSTGLAIVLPFPDGMAAAIDLGTGVTIQPDLHCTLVFLGRAADFSADDMKLISRVVAVWAAGNPPIGGVTAGGGRFMGQIADPVYLTPSCPALAGDRERLVQALAAVGIESDSPHGFIPHVCVAYIDKAAPTPALPVSNPSFVLDRVEIWAGINRESFDLKGRAE